MSGKKAMMLISWLFLLEVFVLENKIPIEDLKNREIENNPFAVFPKSLIEKALEVIEDFTEDSKLD